MRLAQARASKLVPASGSVDDLVAEVSRSRKRLITLLEHDLDSAAPSGLWIATKQADYVVFPVDASSSERTAIICHELAHMVLDHQPEVEMDAFAPMVALVAPSIDPEVARLILARHGYQDGLEAEAEELATVLVSQLSRNAHAEVLRKDAVSDRLR